MQIGRVMGRVWSTAKSPLLEGRKLLLIQPVSIRRQAGELADTGRPVVCVDAVGAGAGEIVYWCRGRESSFPFLPSEVPTDATVVGIVDELHFESAAGKA